MDSSCIYERNGAGVWIRTYDCNSPKGCPPPPPAEFDNQLKFALAAALGANFAYMPGDLVECACSPQVSNASIDRIWFVRGTIRRGYRRQANGTLVALNGADADAPPHGPAVRAGS